MLALEFPPINEVIRWKDLFPTFNKVAIIAYTARISIHLLMGATLFGYLIRLGLIFLAVWVVKDASWISLPALGATIIVTHLGLLVWELKYVAISLAYPALKPTTRSSDRRPTLT